MNTDEALEILQNHPDPKINEAAKLWSEQVDWCIGQFTRIQQTLQITHENMVQFNLDLKYLAFDLEATRRERDELRGAQ
jgi:hypothetical protein